MPKKRNPKKKQPPKKVTGKQLDASNKQEEVGKEKDKAKKRNSYDSYFRKYISELFRPVIELKLDWQIKSYDPLEQLQDKHVVTLVRETDFCYTAELIENKTTGTRESQKVILHIEFQTQKDYKMIYRIAEYHGILFSKYKLPIKHVVIYLGTNKVDMPSKLKRKEIFTGFDLINVWELDVNQCLTSQVPEVIVLAILANYPKDQVEEILEATVERLRAVTQNNKKHFNELVNQLRWLARLRDVDGSLTKKLTDMSIFIDVKKDFLYKEGYAEAKAEAAKEMEAERKRMKAQMEAERKRMEAEKETERKRMEVEKKAERKKMEVEKEAERKRMEAEKKRMIKGLITLGTLDIKAIAQIANVEIIFVEQLKKEME